MRSGRPSLDTLARRGLWPLAGVLVALVMMACDLKPPVATPASPSPLASPSASPEPTPVALTSTTLHSGEVTVAYAPVALSATGGTPPYQWTVGAGNQLPSGLTLASDGTFTGVPTTAGTFDFTIHVTDSKGASADGPAAVKIVPGPSAALTVACAQYCPVEVGCDSTCGTFGSLAGGTGPFTYAVQGGFVPKGVSLSGLSLAGTFTSVAKFWQFTVGVTDALGATTSITPTYYVYPHLSVPGGSCTGNWSAGCTVALAYSGGTPNGDLSVSLSGWAQPACTYPPCAAYAAPSVSATVTGGYLKVTVAGSGAYANRGESGTATLLIKDQSPCASGVYCSTTAAVTVYLTAG